MWDKEYDRAEYVYGKLPNDFLKSHYVAIPKGKVLLLAEGNRMKYLSILFILLLSSCSSQSFNDKVTDQIFEQVTGKEYTRNAAQCSLVKRQCTSGNYEEWIQENGQKACACN